MEDTVNGECTKPEKIDLPAVVNCTICHSKFDYTEVNELRSHFQLNVLVCKECYDFYGTNEFSQDESGNFKYCTWCGNGGKLFLCDFCPNSFCSPCVMFNFGREEVSKMKRERWKCFVCRPKQLQAKITLCKAILKQNADESENQLSFVNDAFDKSNDAIMTFKRSLNKLRKMEVSKSKSLKHVIKKWEDIVDVHKRELKNIMTNLSDQYKVYVNEQRDADVDFKTKNSQKMTNYIDSDSKLNKCTVFLKKCDNIIPFGTTTINVPRSHSLKSPSNKVEKLTGLKKVKEKSTPKRNNADDKKQNLKTLKGEASKRTSSLSEITFSSSDEKEIENKKVDDILQKLNNEKSDKNVTRKPSSNFKDLLSPFDSEDESKANSDSSHDIQKSTKRKKNDKISKERILSDEEKDARGTSEKENEKTKKNKKTQSDDEKQSRASVRSSSSDSEMVVVRKKKKANVSSSDEWEELTKLKKSRNKGSKNAKRKIRKRN